jgi:hypothetical protein
MESVFALSEIHDSLCRRRALLDEAQRLKNEIADLATKNRVIREESRRLRGADQRGPDREIVQRVIAVLWSAGFAAVEWDGGPLPVVAPQPPVIQ